MLYHFLYHGNISLEGKKVVRVLKHSDELVPLGLFRDLQKGIFTNKECSFRQGHCGKQRFRNRSQPTGALHHKQSCISSSCPGTTYKYTHSNMIFDQIPGLAACTEESKVGSDMDTTGPICASGKDRRFKYGLVQSLRFELLVVEAQMESTALVKYFDVHPPEVTIS